MDSFLQVWVRKTNDERGPDLMEVYKDSAFTYYMKRGPDYYKIKNTSLQQIDFMKINGDTIRHKFYSEIIPTADIEKQKNCSTSLISFDCNYFYIETENAIRIDCHYKILCELIFPTVNKHYSAKYYINENTIENLTIAKMGK